MSNLTWEPDKFKAELLKQLEENGDLMGQFVEDDARRRLWNITEPEWGAGYRGVVVAELLTHTVERKENEVVITVGVATSSKSSHHGFYIEMGSSRFPAQPFIRPAVFENGGKIVALLSGK